MTSIESRSYCRVVVIAPSTRVDLALPADVAIIDLLPMLLQYTGEARDDGGGTHGGWKLTRVGHGERSELEGGRTLRSLDVADGEVLRLTAREDRTVAPVFDDIVDAIATTRRERLNTRAINPGVGAGVLAAAMSVAAFTLFVRGRSYVDAYIAGAVALALLGLGTATVKGIGERIIATTAAASGVPFAVVCGLNAVPGTYGRWGVLLGSTLALVYSLAASLALGTGTVVFAATAIASFFAAGSALIGGLTHVHVVQIVAGTIAIALAALSILPRLAVRLARLPLATVPTTSEDLSETDEVGDIDDVSARARVAGEYLTGTQIGCAVTVAVSGTLLLGDAPTPLSVALAATALVAMALRARSVSGLGARIALVTSAAACAFVAALVAALRHRLGTGLTLLVAELIAGALTLVLSTSGSRRRPSPQTLRLIDFFEAAVVVAVLPLAVGVMGLYGVLRSL
ncbi:MAG TPA: type VII secretion integral membrane protein EccD [Jatrophihabitans sp.]